MPLLAVWIGSLFAGLAGWFAQWMSKKVAFGAAAVATFGLLTVALVGAMQALLAGIVLTFPETHTMVLTIMWLGIPDNATTCIAVCLSADTAIALYRWNVENLRLVSYIT